MFRFRSAKMVAAAVADLEAEAIRDWHRDHGPSKDVQELLATEVKEVHTIVVRRSGGNISVTVSVLCRKPWDSETYFYLLQNKGNGVDRVERKL